MIVKDFLPSLPLSDFVSQYRVRHFVFKTGIIPSPKPFAPRPEQCLTFYVLGFEKSTYLRDNVEVKKTRSVISGQFTQRVNRYVSVPEILMIIVDFKPGALYRLCGVPFNLLADKDIDAEAIFSSKIRAVNERLGNTADYSEMIRIVDSFLSETVKQQKRNIIAIDNIFNLITNEFDHSIDSLATRASLSSRQLERKFYERVGVGPKTFQRICRFNHSYWMHLKHPQLHWFDIAMICGYTDYQHLAKEYNTFANGLPNKFFAEESKAPGRVMGLNRN